MDNSDVLERAANVAELLVEQVMFKRHTRTITFGSGLLPCTKKQILSLFVWRTDENGDKYYTDEAQELFNRYYSEALEVLDNG